MPDERVDIRLMGNIVGQPRADATGALHTPITVPASPSKGQFDVEATGAQSIKSAPAPFHAT